MRYQLHQHNLLANYFTLINTNERLIKDKYFIMVESRIQDICSEFAHPNKWYYATKDELVNHHLHFEFDTLEELQNKFAEYLI